MNEEPAYQLIDISVKRLVRDNPAGFLELIGFTVAPDHVAFEDTAIQQRERRADHTCLITNANGVRRGVIYLEYQLVPDPDIVKDWIWKWAGLVQRFPVPVVLLVVYLNRGNYVTFQQDYRAQLDWLETAVRFNTVRFWECADQIRSGRYPDFIPLLCLCEDHPTEATIRDQVTLIQGLELGEARKQELLSLSFLVASRDIARDILLRIVQEVFTMKTLPPIVEDMFGDALREREREHIQEAEKLAEERGEERGALKEARTTLMRLYAKRLGIPPEEVVAKLESIENIGEIHALTDRYDEQVESWEQLLS